MGTRTPVSSLIEDQNRHHSLFSRAHRRRKLSSPRICLADNLRLDSPITTAYEPVQPLLKEILRSTADVLSAHQAFIIVARGEALIEVACTHNIRPSEVVDAVTTGARGPVQTALKEKILTAGDIQGAAMPLLDGFFENNSPAILCVPLDLGSRLAGVLCLLRRHPPRRLSDLDLEIVQALAEQAALAIGAATHSSALSRLKASLSRPSPIPAYA